MRLSLGSRLFLITALGITVAVASAVAVTVVVGRRIADATVREALERSATVQAVRQGQQLEQLALLGRVFASDAALAAYVAESAETRDTGSILDLLEERQRDLGYDFAIALDPDGSVLARTDDPAAVGEDLSRHPLVTRAFDELEAYGFWLQRDGLYQAAAVPLTRGRLLLGFLIAGFRVDQGSALEIRRVSDAEVVFLAGTAEAPWVVGSTLEPGLQEDLTQVLAARPEVLRPVLAQGRAVAVERLVLRGRPWAAQARPLVDAAGSPVGASLSLASRDRELAPVRRISAVLAGVGLAAVLLASIASFFLSRRALRPVRRLTRAAEAASAGDYRAELPPAGGDEVGRLAAALAALLAELRERQDMEAYLAELSRSLPAAGAERPATPAARETVALVGVDLAGMASRVRGEEPATLAAALAEAVRRLETAATARGGRRLGSAGARLVFTFPGPERCRRAADTAAEMVGLRDAFAPAEPPRLAVAEGEVLTGTLAGGEEIVLGLPLAQLDALLAEAQAGEVAIAPACHSALAADLAARGLDLPARRGVRSAQTLHLLPAEAARRLEGLTGVGEATLAAPAGDGRGGEPAAVPALPAGTVLAERFEILEVLGSGGMGIVYKVRDRELDDVVALKMLRPGWTADGGNLERLKDELKLARRIVHPNVLRPFDFGDIGGSPFITMEYVRGVTLRQLLEQSGRLPYAAGLHVARQLCRGLAAAHAEGIVHRDIKPENLLVRPNGQAKLMDFGIARPLARPVEGVTTPGTVVGTPRYLAPEQLRGQGADERSDLYACGVVLYELFTARLPFAERSGLDAVAATLQLDPEPPRRHWPEMPPVLEAIILRCLEKEPAKRHPGAAALLAELEALRG